VQRTLLALTSTVALVAAFAGAASAGLTLAHRNAPAQNLAIGGGAVCRVPYSDAAIANAAQPELPRIAKEQGIAGTAVIEIRLSPSGKLVAGTIANSSGNPWLDREALASAAQSKYVPETQDCNAVGGTYLLTVDFNS
jgi:TonB family protein